MVDVRSAPRFAAAAAPARPSLASSELIARVGLDDEQAAGLAGDREDAREHRVDARRREDLAADRGRQHALAHEAGVRRLVACAAAGDDRDLRAVPVGTHHDLDGGIPVEPGELAFAEHHGGVDRLRDDGAPIVDEVLHAAIVARRARGARDPSARRRPTRGLLPPA